MLFGLYTSILDSDNRLAVPDGIQETFKNGIYITRGFDRSIMMLTKQAFESIYERVTALNLADPTARLLLRLILGSTTQTEISSDGTLTVPIMLKRYANLTKDVVIVGQGDFMEVWSQDDWIKQEEQLSNLDPQRFSSLNLSTR